MEKRVKICLISSHGGHLRELLSATEDVIGDKYYVTHKSKHTKELLKNYRHYFIIDPHRSIFKYIINIIQSLFHALKERPKLVITTGAGIVVPSVLICKYLLGARIIFIESAANVINPSRTGKFLYKRCDLFLIQWQSLKKHYPKAHYIGLI
jgi:UDP-N-acetylglucosamine:LPS N-acetylglucosamine transferase